MPYSVLCQREREIVDSKKVKKKYIEKQHKKYRRERESGSWTLSIKKDEKNWKERETERKETKRKRIWN